MAVQLPAQPPRNAVVEPRGSVHTGPYRSGRAAPPAMLLAWRASHLSMLLVLGVHGSDPRLSLPTDPVSDPTPVGLMAGGANQVCLWPDRPAVDSWLAGPQC